ncbi:MAG: metal-sensing transcriptional repressor [Planctomycetota bacterium]|jgi:DNA-binding FrmR family transcriptional regulator|nr:metal-sensing transcriptional repressor [Planctomycetota bacterium]
MSEIHRTHPSLVKRLKRAHGHLARVITMVEDGRPCVDLAQQLYAVEKAVAKAKSTLIHDHINHCLDDLVETDGHMPSGDREAELNAFKEITRYL